jgi:hypothetical protein
MKIIKDKSNITIRYNLTGFQNLLGLKVVRFESMKQTMAFNALILTNR